MKDNLILQVRTRKTEKGKKAKKRIILETAVAILIALAPFIFKLYELFPDEPGATVSFLGFEIDDNGWTDVQWRMWFLAHKLIPLYLMIIWFLSCKHWWYHIILIPMIMFVFQIFEDIFDQDKVVDTDNLLWLLPICIVLIPFVYFIRLKLYDKHVHGIDLEAMDAELRILKEKEELRKERQKLEERKTTLLKKM